MKKKKVLVILLIIAIFIGQISFINFFKPSYALTEDVEGTEWNRYFYKQLKGDAVKIYDAMFKMYQKGMFARGESYEITNEVSATSIALFTKGNNQLLNDYGAARDAFQYDYPDCFYVDFSQLSVRVTQDGTGALRAFLGAGRSADYFLPYMNPSRSNGGIEGAVAEYNKKLGQIVKEVKETAKAKVEKDGGDLVVEQIGAAHDYLTKTMSYKYEDEVTNFRCNARTAYDGLIYNEGVCEAYTRSFKAILDRLEIPCVCVTGVYRPNDKINEPHIWNYVRVNGKWYGVDVTHDDSKKGVQTRDFFLVGATELAGHHYPSAVFSEANYEFEYPPLEIEQLRESYLVEDDSGFKVRIVKDTDVDENETIDTGTYYVSYEGKNFSQNAEQGKFIIVKYFTYSEAQDEWTVSEWSYLDPWIMGEKAWKELEPDEPNTLLGGEYYVKILGTQVRKAQFAITSIPPLYWQYRTGEKPYTPDELGNCLVRQNGGYYHGNPIYLETISREFENEWGTYQAPPYPKKATPIQSGALYIGQTYHMKWEFDDKLVPVDGQKIDVVIGETWNPTADSGSSTGLDYSKVEHITFDGDKTIEFDFTPSAQYSDDYCFYNFYVKGLVGNWSGKSPIAMTYMAMFARSCYAYKANGYDHNVYANPQLIDTADINTKNWVTEDMETGEQETLGDRIKDSLTHRLTLVTTETTGAEQKNMEEALLNNKEYSQDFGKEGTVSKTYNIRLSICKKQVVKTGDGVRVALGFPAGTTYEDFAKKGTFSFKAYHYIVNPETNELTGEVEEIPVTVTPQGLILLVDSFSPFTVAAIPNDEPVIPEKSLLITSTEGGKVTKDGETLEGAKGTLKLNAGEEATLTITPDENYEIDSIMIDGVRQSISNKQGQEFKINYNNINAGSTLETKFVAKEIHEEEKEKGLNSELTIPKVTIAVDDNEVEAIEGHDLKISTVVSVTGEGYDDVEYIWLRGGTRDEDGYVYRDITEDMATKRDQELIIPNCKLSDSKTYHLLIIPLRRNPDTQELERIPDSTGHSYYTVSSQPIKVTVYPPINLDLKGPEEEESKLQGSTTDGYTLQMSHREEYNLTADTYRIYEGKNTPEGRVVEWNSSDDKTVSVDNTGKLTAVGYKEEPVTITAKVTDLDGTTKEATVEVTSNKVPVIGVEIQSDKEEEVPELKVGEELALRAVVNPENASEPDVTWKVTQGGEHVSVSQEGVVTANSLGAENADVEATIEATADGQSDTYNVKVVKTPVERIIDQFDREEDRNIYLIEGEQIKINAEVYPIDATEKTLEWSVEGDSSVASVDQNGTITGGEYVADANTCKVVVKSKDNPAIKLEYTVTISEEIKKVDTVTIVPEDKTLKIGEEFDFGVEIEPEDATYSSVEWSVDHDDVISVDQSGYVVAKKEGDATITVTVTCATPDCNGKHTAEATVHVEKIPVTDIELSETELTLDEGTEATITATVVPDNATYKDITWETTSSGVATVDGGVIKALAPGNATIKVTADGVTRVCDVTVNKVIIPVEGIELEGTKEQKLKEGETRDLVAKVYPSTATNQTLKWSSDAPDVVEVDQSGKITAKKPGTATIKISINETPDASSKEIFEEYTVEVVPAKTDLTVYTVDQIGNFIPFITVKLVRIENEADTSVSETEIDVQRTLGKYEFKDLPDGEYVLYQTILPDEDGHGNEYEIKNFLSEYRFVIVDGEVSIPMLNDSGEIISHRTGTIVLVNTTNDEEPQAVTGEKFDEGKPDTLAERYEEFSKGEFIDPDQKEPDEDDPTKPGEDDPTKPGEDDPTKPGEDDPTKPGEDDPTKPGEDDPTKPGEDDPAKPGEDDPAKPGEDDPTKPGEDDPTKPGEDNPSAPGEDNPSVPGGDAQDTPEEPTAPDAPESTTPAGQGNSNTPAKSDNDDDVPKTGDISIGKFVVVMIVSLVAIVLILRSKGRLNRKKRNRN